MTGFRDFLTRFRPVATPGRASPPAGIPADRTAALRAELGPPLALLEDAETAARDLRRQAAVAAAARRSEAENKAAEILAQARLQAHRTRERAAEETARASEREAAEMLADADRKATAVREAARTRTSDLADRAVALVLADIAADRLPSPTPEAES